MAFNCINLEFLMCNVAPHYLSSIYLCIQCSLQFLCIYNYTYLIYNIYLYQYIYNVIHCIHCTLYWDRQFPHISCTPCISHVEIIIEPTSHIIVLFYMLWGLNNICIRHILRIQLLLLIQRENWDIFSTSLLFITRCAIDFNWID